MGAALFIGFSLQIIGLQYTTPSKNAFLTATNVVIVPFIAFLICRKKVGFRGTIGAVLAIVGVGLLSLDKDLSLGLGDGLTLICAVGFAFQIFLTSIFVKKYRASVLNFIQMCTAGILSLIFMIASGQVHFRLLKKDGGVFFISALSAQRSAIFFRQHARSMWMRQRRQSFCLWSLSSEPCSRL